MPSLVEGLVKTAPAANTAIGNILKLPTITFENYKSSVPETVGSKILKIETLLLIKEVVIQLLILELPQEF